MNPSQLNSSVRHTISIARPPMDDRRGTRAMLQDWMRTTDRTPTTALFEEWARADPAFLTWYKATFSGVSSGAISLPLSLPKLLQAVDALSTLPDGAGPAAVRDILAPLWEIEFRYPYEAGV